VSGAASDPAGLLRRLRARGGGPASPASATPAPDAPTGAADAAAGGAALLRAAGAGAEALAAADPDLARERAECAAGLRAEAPDPARAGLVEVLPNGTRLHHCRTCGRLAAWGFGVALDRGRDGTWFCFEHRGRAE
jgi:hypothetical protein